MVNVVPGVIMTRIFENSAEETRYDRTSPYQPIMGRYGKVFAVGFNRAVPPEKLAEATPGRYRLAAFCYPQGCIQAVVPFIRDRPLRDAPDGTYYGAV